MFWSLASFIKRPRPEFRKRFVNVAREVFLSVIFGDAYQPLVINLSVRMSSVMSAYIAPRSACSPFSTQSGYWSLFTGLSILLARSAAVITHMNRLGKGETMLDDIRAI